jgi:hypothetical protein
MRLKLLNKREILNFVNAYAPQIGSHELDGVLQSIPRKVGGNLNGHVVCTQSDFESEHDGFGYGTKNREGDYVLDCL